MSFIFRHPKFCAYWRLGVCCFVKRKCNSTPQFCFLGVKSEKLEHLMSVGKKVGGCIERFAQKVINKWVNFKNKLQMFNWWSGALRKEIQVNILLLETFGRYKCNIINFLKMWTWSSLRQVALHEECYGWVDRKCQKFWVGRV